jgi:hypothetical protein
VVLKKYLHISVFVNMAEMMKYASLAVTIGGLIFQAGRQSERIDELFTKAYAAETERKDVKEVIYDMHGRICAIENDVKRLLK